MSFSSEDLTPLGAKIKVIGVGGGGGNAINTMINASLGGVDFIAANTDLQSLRLSLAENVIQIGKDLTKGLGAGADPDVGREAALENRQEIQEQLAGADMVFVTAGMGGGTGTGAATIISQIARELGALTVAVVTKPFSFEGKRRKKHADLGIARLRECVDTLITIPNQRLLAIADPNTSMLEAFKLVDNILYNAVKSISDIVNVPGTVNVDFADVNTIMASMGQALMGTGHATGDNRSEEAARQAISSPLLEDVDIEGATGILINISAGSNITLMEINDACSVVQEAAHEDANIIFGAVIDENLGDEIRVTVIATGFPLDVEEEDSIEVLRHQQQIISKTTGLGNITTPQIQRPIVEQKPAAQQPMITRLTTSMETPTAASREATAIVEPASKPVAQPVVETVSKIEEIVEVEKPTPTIEEVVDTTEEVGVESNTMSSVSEAQELAQWTMGLWESPSLEDNASSDPIPAETHEEDKTVEEPPLSDLSELDDEPIHLEGAVRAEEETAPLSKPDDERLFGAQAQDDSLAPVKVEPEDESDETLLVDNGPAPLESFFVNEANSIATDIDRKIDEALERAESTTLVNDIKVQDISEDDLDVPAFLRTGIKDLSLD